VIFMIRLGIENEFTSFEREADIESVSFGRIESVPFPSDEEIMSRIPNLIGHINPTSQNLYLLNGARVYPDLSTVREYASPECESVRDVVLADKAGDVIMNELFGNRDDPNFFLMKRSASQQMSSENTWGAHESYAIGADLFDDLVGQDNVRSLVLQMHLASRIVYSGAGHCRYVKDASPPLTFFISPRAPYITRRASAGTISSKPKGLINTKNENLVSELDVKSRWRRLHLICGDMNRSDWSLYLRLGATLLVLVYLSRASRKSVSRLASEIAGDDPLEIMHLGSMVFNHQKTRDCFYILVAIQCRLFNFLYRERELLESIVPEAKSILELLNSVLDDVVISLQPGSTRISDKLDWLIKKRLFEEKIGDSLSGLGRLNGVSDKSLCSEIVSQKLLPSWIRHFYNPIIAIAI